MLESISSPYRARHNSASLAQEAISNREQVVNDQDQTHLQDSKLLISLVIPAYNETAIIERNLKLLCRYLTSIESVYDWELIIVNDGSSDDTGIRAELFAQSRSNVLVVHHLTNLGLGQALKSGFNQCQGDYIVTLDLDLSYSPEYIECLLSRARDTGAKVVVASPYMKGGKVSNVPWLRRMLSIWANRFLSFTAKRSLTTLTGMVRAYDRKFLQGINLKSAGMDINPEVIHKARILNARIEEIPAHLNWQVQKSKKLKRKSSMKILKHTWAIIFSGFLIRPVMFFLIPSLMFFVLSLYASAWALIHCWTNYQQMARVIPFPDPTEAVAKAFSQAPHTFVIGGMSLMLAIQLFSLGILALQSKSYFEEIFYLGSAIYRSSQKEN